MEDYIDTHNHILPGLDDGPDTLQEALDMARVALKNGITKIVATPHHNEYHHPPAKEILAMVELVRSGLKKEALPVEVYPGNELRISPDLPEQLKAGEVLSLAGSKYILLEFPFEGIPIFADDIIFRLRIDGWKPILAHAERIYDIQRKPERLKKYIDMGCMVQVNSNSLTGELGRASLDVGIKFLKKGWVDVLASDAHAASYRAPDFTDALKVAAKHVGKERALAMISDNPGRVFFENEQKSKTGQVD